jgi:lysophospholipase L1-like esterase
MKRSRKSSIQVGALVAVILLAGHGRSDARQAAAPAGSPGPSSAAREPDAHGKAIPIKLLFLGNSITLHGPAPAIGWSGNWGMAASAREKDYVHLVTGSLARTTGTAPEVLVKNIVDFERHCATFDAAAKLPDALAFKADLIIVAIGENVPSLDRDEAKDQFAKSLTKLLRALTADPHPTLIVRSCFWPNKAKDLILRQACASAGGIFVDISGLSQDEANYARSERPFKHSGVARHPGDRGMQAIAAAILEAINRQGRKAPGR